MVQWHGNLILAPVVCRLVGYPCRASSYGVRLVVPEYRSLRVPSVQRELAFFLIN